MRISPSQQTKCIACGAALLPTETHCWVCGAVNSNTGAPVRKSSTSGTTADTSAADAVARLDIIDEAELTAAQAAESTPSRTLPRRGTRVIRIPQDEAAGATPTAVARRNGTRITPSSQPAGPRQRVARPMKPTRLKGAPRYIGAKPPTQLSPLVVVIPLSALLITGALAYALFNRPVTADVEAAAIAAAPTTSAPVIETQTPIVIAPIVATTAPPTLPPTVPAPTSVPTAAAVVAPAVTIVPTAIPPTAEVRQASPTLAPTLVPPTSAPIAAPIAAPTIAASPTPSQQTYTVVSGDTCGKIAKAFSVTVEAIIAANALAPNCPLAIDQKLTIPIAGAPTAPPAAATPTAQAPTATTAAPPTATVAPIASSPLTTGTLYTIKPGDSCYTIAQANGVTVEALIAANGLDASCLLRAGKPLIIPKAP